MLFHVIFHLMRFFLFRWFTGAFFGGASGYGQFLRHPHITYDTELLFNNNVIQPTAIARPKIALAKVKSITGTGRCR